MKHWLVIVPIVISLFGLAPRAWAVEVEFWPESYFQLQQYRDVDQLKIDKTRFTQYLTTNIYEESDVPCHLFFSSLRLDMDLGRDHSPDAEEDPMAAQEFSVLYAYYEWRRIGNAVDLTLGRQLLSDEFGLYPFDGARAVVSRNWYIGLDVHAGSEVKGALSEEIENFKLPNSDTFEPDGVIGDDRLTGAFGAAVFLDGVPDTAVRVQYRHRYSGETDGQDLGLVFRQHLIDHWELYTIDSYSVLLERFGQLRFGTTIDLDRVAVNLDHSSENPDFDGDSIFNFFPMYAQKEISANFYLKPDHRTHLQLGYSRLHQGDDSPIFNSWGHDGNASHVVRGSVSRLLGECAQARTAYEYSRGWGGDLHRFLVGAGTYVFHRRVRFEGDWVGTVFNRLLYTDILEGGRNRGLSLGAVLQTEFELADEVSLLIQGDVYSNQFIERQFGLFSVLDIHVWL